MNTHFIGIGGIGVSALAKYYKTIGATITGSDLASSEITDELAALGIPVAIGKHTKNTLPKHTERVIYTAAVAKTNLEMKAALARRIPRKSYAEALGELTKQYQTITVSGSHGKSTTTALAALVLEEGYFDPTVIAGTKIKEFGNSNFRHGSGSHLVLEADEWNKSFLNYSPKIAIVTNIDTEHLDTYKTLANIKKTFETYLARVPKDGVIIANRDDQNLYLVAEKFGKMVRWYSLQDPEAHRIRKILKVPGEHNVSNALAALTLGRTLGIRETDILHALSRFSGTWRRFEFSGIMNGAYLFSDYAHHPTEIKATIAAARERFPFRRIWCVYQPHQQKRLEYLWEEFINAFDMADRVSLLPVYEVAGRERNQKRKIVSSSTLARELVRRGKDAYHINTFKKAHTTITAEARPGDVLLVMGAGDVYNLTKNLTRYI